MTAGFEAAQAAHDAFGAAAALALRGQTIAIDVVVVVDPPQAPGEVWPGRPAALRPTTTTLAAAAAASCRVLRRDLIVALAGAGGDLSDIEGGRLTIDGATYAVGPPEAAGVHEIRLPLRMEGAS